MPRKGRLFVPMDVNLVRDAHEAGLSDSAIVLFLAILADCKARRTDGFTTRSALRSLGVQKYGRVLPLLIRSGWIVEVAKDVWQVPSWDKWHESEAAIEARKKADRDRKRVAGKIPRTMWRVPS